MVKLYITTDRTFRYDVRSNNKQLFELNNTIKKKTNDLNMYIEDNRQICNSLSRTNGFNRMIYNSYSELYKKYTNIIGEFDKCRNYLLQKEKELEENVNLYNNLEDIYNEKVTECEKLKNSEKNIADLDTSSL